LSMSVIVIEGAYESNSAEPALDICNSEGRLALLELTTTIAPVTNSAATPLSAIISRDRSRSAVSSGFWKIVSLSCMRSPSARRETPLLTGKVTLTLRPIVPVAWSALQYFEHSYCHALTIILPISSVGETMLPRKSRSLPIISMELSISRRLPAMVTPCTGKASSPFSIHIPATLLE
jgi:hypothetical protein